MADVAALSIHLHPLVLVNISDHVVRFRHTGKAQERVIGALLGALEGRRVDVHTSFELIVEPGEETAIDLEFFQQRLAQYLEVFPKYEFLGWYSTGVAPRDSDRGLHKKIQEVSANENPYALMVDVIALAQQRAAGVGGVCEELPVKVYDSEVHLEGGTLKVGWKEVPYAIDTLEAERISITHVAKAAAANSLGQASDFTQHTNSLGNSVAMLNGRVKELLEYMRLVRDGSVPRDHDVLRRTLTVCRALRKPPREGMQGEFCQELNDASLVVLLGTLTKACANTSDLVEKFSFSLTDMRKSNMRSKPQQYPYG